MTVLTTLASRAVLLVALGLSTPLAAEAQDDQARQAQTRRELEANRARWRANPIAHYRLRVSSFNPLHRSVTESDVRNGSVLAARGSSGMPGVDAKPGSGSWGPFDGETVETLFQRIEDALRGPGLDFGGQRIPFVVSATYHAGRGYPTRIHIGPASMEVYDADVSIEIELIEAPATPLIAPSPGEAYRTPVAARIVNPGVAYDTLFGFGSDEAARIVRRVWPQRADEIIGRAADPYWRSVGWVPRAGLLGDIIGTFTLPSGAVLYLLEFHHNGRTLFLPIEKSGVMLVR